MTINLKNNHSFNHVTVNLPRSGGKSTEFGAGDFISAAIGPRRTVGVHFCSLTTILLRVRIDLSFELERFVDFLKRMETIK